MVMTTKFSEHLVPKIECSLSINMPAYLHMCNCMACHTIPPRSIDRSKKYHTETLRSINHAILYVMKITSILYQQTCVCSIQGFRSGLVKFTTYGVQDAITNSAFYIFPDYMWFILTHWGQDKWPPFSRRHFQMHFLQWKCINFDSNFTEVCSQGSN